MTTFVPGALDDSDLAVSWSEAWDHLARPAPSGLLAELMSAWSEPHRHYHDQRRLRECLSLWTRWRDQAERPGELALALWFHDAVCDPRSGNNELHSAAWAARSVLRAGVDSDVAQRVHDLVMCTQPDAPDAQHVEAHGDVRLLKDIDLAILGSLPERFEEYDRDVRKEVAWIPRYRYREMRERQLQAYLRRPRIYRSEPATTFFETQARINLSAALSRLAL